MIPKSIFLLLFLGLTVRSSISKEKNENDFPTNFSNLRRGNEFVLVNPKQVQRLENTLHRFLSNVAEPVKGSIVLRPAFEGNNLQRTIRNVCECIRTKWTQFAYDCGMRTTVQRSMQTSTKLPLSEDWFSETLLQAAYVLRDLANTIDEIKKSIDQYFGHPNATLQRNKLSRKADNLEFLGVVNDATYFSERLTQCLIQMSKESKYRRSFDLNRSLLNLTKSPTKEALKILRFNLNRASTETFSKKHPRRRSWQHLLCNSLMNSEKIRYSDCIRDLQHLTTCLRNVKQRSSSGTRKTEVKSWTRAIQRLSNCKIQEEKDGKLLVSCKTDLKMPKKMKDRVEHIFGKILGKRIPKRSPLSQAVNDLGDTLSRCEWGRRFVEELSQYLAIYEDGQRKLQGFSKTKNERAGHEVWKALQVYKRGIRLRIFDALNGMHKSATNFERYFVDGIKTTLNEIWQSHVKVLSSLMRWVTKLLGLYTDENASGEEQYSSDTSVTSVMEPDESVILDSGENLSSNLENSVGSRSRSDIMKDVDASLNDLMKSMNDVTRHRATNNNSMLSCLANNLLLITMFAETVGFISTLFCSGHAPKEEANSPETSDQWRKRRSLLPWDYQEDLDAVSREYLLFQVEQNATAWFNDESD